LQTGSLKNFLKNMLTPNRKLFLLILACYVIAMQSFILWTNKGTEILYFCYQRKTFLTDLFKIITHLGEWLGLVAIAFYFLIKNRRALVSAVIAFVSIDLLLVYLKKTLDYPRPLLYYNRGEITPVPDFTPLYYHSMPSGHTFTAFFCATFVLFFFDMNKKWQVILFSTAILVGISRMYLMCHFKEDVFIGSIMGIIAGISSVYIYEKGLRKI